MRRVALTIALATFLAGSAWATTKTVVLTVQGMTCAVCPITVKKALNQVRGVEKVDVNFDKKEATVTFDDTKTNPAALMKATKNAGYPSRPVGSAH